MVKVTGIDMFFECNNNNLRQLYACIKAVAEQNKIWSESFPIPHTVFYDKDRK